MLTQRPGFQDPIHDAQRSFRVLLDGLAHPGTIRTLALTLEPPEGLNLACAAACLTLLDLETQLWLQPECSEAIRHWLQFHTGCRFTDHAQKANFALAVDAATAPPLELFSIGTPEFPEASTTLLLLLPSLTGGKPVSLQGPGIRQRQPTSPALPTGFWRQWQVNHRQYPLGIDVFCFAGSQVMGLPRSTAAAELMDG